jgi:Mg2+-importing ATPase
LSAWRVLKAAALQPSAPVRPAPRAGALVEALWREPVATLLERLASRAEGLSGLEAARRLERDGHNVVAERRRHSLLVQLLLRFRNPLVLLLIGAAALSGVTGDVRSFVVIVVMVLLSVVLDFVQEHRAGQAAERLRQAALTRATVLRDSQPRDLPAAEIVAGDVVVLSAGDLVPADGRLLEARDLFVSQALLTGEPYPVEKRANGVPADQPALAEAEYAVLMGTSIVSGSARAVIVRTGPRTMLGQIGASLQREPPPTAFEQGTRAFGLLILRLALLMVLFVLLVNAWRGRAMLDSFLFAIALAVGLTPELLPMVVSVTLSRGAMRMARKKVLVKRLAAILDLGSIDVLCTDKTGTLTEARIRLEQHLDAAGRDSRRVLELVYLNSRFESGLKSPLDEAILRHEEIDVSAWRKLDEIPFDFERRCVSVLVCRGSEAPIMVIKGAFEDMLRLSSRYEDETGAARPLDTAVRANLVARFEGLSREGFRVLGVASKPCAQGCAAVAKGDEGELVFAGFAAFLDPPKESARAALRGLAELGVGIKVLTGDNELVAEHVCRQLEVPVAAVLTGAQIETMDDQALEARAEGTTLFCRVTPAQKNRILLALKRRKHVVGFLGDGINDAPALHAADVGISVEGAVDVAKEAADLILLERDLDVLRDAVVEGRRTFANIIKYVLMGTSSNFGNMFSMAGAALFLPFLPMLPIQILVNNFLYDLSEVPIPLDAVDADLVRAPHRWDMKFIRRFMMVIGPVSSAFDFFTFYVLYRVMHANAALFHTGWFIESLATQVLVIFVIRTRGNPLRSRPSRVLIATAALVVGTALLLPFTPLGATLGFVRPPAVLFAVVAATVVVYLFAVELVKRLFYRHLART